MSQEIADVQRLMQKSGLSYSMHSAGTTVEGSWDDVMRLIGQAHSMLHEKGALRIQTDIRVGSRSALHLFEVCWELKALLTSLTTRIDKKQSFEEKVIKVNQILAKDPESGTTS